MARKKQTKNGADVVLSSYGENEGARVRNENHRHA